MENIWIYKNVEVEAFQAVLDRVAPALGRSDVHRKLLHYLAERSRRNDFPKELDIAVDVFGRDASFNGAEDAVVRVNVRALRLKLEEYYRGAGAQDPLRLEIPKGGYRLNIVPAHTPAEDDSARHEARQSRKPLIVIAATTLLILLVVSVAGNVALLSRHRQAPVSILETFVWSGLADSRRPITVILGDLLLFSTIDSRTNRFQLVRDPEINTEAQLRKHLVQYPEPALPFRHVTFLPKSAAYALADVLPVIKQTGRPVMVTILDELDLQHVQSDDIVYIGPLVRLGPLSEAFSKVSRYRYDDTNLTLLDGERRYATTVNGDEVTEHSVFASFLGPAGNRVMIIASNSRDAGVLQIARHITSPELIESMRKALLEGRSVPPQEFEILLEVKGYRRAATSARILDAHALGAGKD